MPSTPLLAKANEERKAGKLVRAAELYQNVLQAEPENADAFFGLAQIAFDKRHYANAEKLILQTLKLTPDHAAANTLLGTLYSTFGWKSDAIKQYEIAIENQPDYMPAYNDMAIAYIQMNEPWEAGEICRKAISIKKDYAPIHNVYGEALVQEGKKQEALESYKYALKICADAEKAPILSNIGVLYSLSDEDKKAIEALREALANDSNYTYAHYLISQNHKYKKDDPHIDEIKESLKTVPANSDEAAYLHFALGNAYDQIGDYDAAFSEYATGNYICRQWHPFDQKALEENFAKFIDTYKKTPKNLKLPEPETNLVPIFIVGMPRSGTTLAEQILYSHPDVGAAGETTHLEYALWNQGLHDLSAYDYDLAKIPVEKLAAARDEFLTKLQHHTPEKKYITEKLPTNFRYVGFIKTLFPNAKIIHCQRDAMDTCWSIFKRRFNATFFFAYDLQDIAAYYTLYRDMMNSWKEQMPDFIFDLQYEDLVNDQEGLSRKLIQFCGLEWNDSCLDFHKQERLVATASATQVKKPLYKSGVGAWEKYKKHLAPLKKALQI